MKVFIAGARGVLGKRLVKEFRARGHDVIGLARSEANERVIRFSGGEPRRADLFDADSLARAAWGVDVVVHAATNIPTKVRTRPEDWATNDRIRRDGTRALLAATAAVSAQHYVQQSIVWLAQPQDGSWFDEGSRFRSAHPAFQSMIDAETYVADAIAREGFTASVLRCGLFYSADSAHTRQLGEALARRRLPIIGDGSAVWRLLHVDDAATAFVTAAEAGSAGLWHVVDEEAVTVAQFLTALAERLGARVPRRVPGSLARLIVGRETAAFFTGSTRTSNDRIRHDLGWSPGFPTFREGLDGIVADWKHEGFPHA